MEDRFFYCGAKAVRWVGRTVVLIDESGLIQRPARMRIWAPKGQTPVQQYRCTCKQHSAIAGMSNWNSCFRLFPGGIRNPQLVEFLTALPRKIRGKPLIVLEVLKAYTSLLVRAFVESKGDVLNYLSAYAPELDSVEYVRGHLKNREVASLCRVKLHEFSEFARR